MLTLINLKEIEMTNIDELKEFCDMSNTDFSFFFYNLVKDDIKIIGKESDVYYYNNEKSLWCCLTKEVYITSMVICFSKIGMQLDTFFTRFKFELLSQYKRVDKVLEEKVDYIGQSVKHMVGKLDKMTFIKDILERSLGMLQDNEFVTKLNTMHDYFSILNGNKINLITGEVTKRTKEDLFDIECPVELTESTEHAEKFFKEIMPIDEEREYLRSILGYMLTGNMDARCFFIFYGTGANGKSVVMKLMDAMMKKLYHQTSKGIFMKGSQEKVDGPSPDKIALIGVRCGFYSEGETADEIDINESFLKMVSGKDKINARALFKAPLTFYPVCKLALASNYKPDLQGDDSIRDRIRYIFFESRFTDKPDKNKKNEFKRDDEFVDLLLTKYLSEVFTWIVKGSQNYYKTKTITPPKSFLDRTNLFFEQQDSITSFINNKLVITENEKDYLRRGELFEIYKTYCNNNSQRCQPRSTVFKRMDDLKIITAKKDGYDVFRCVKIANGENEEPSMFIKENDKAEYIRAEEFKKITDDKNNEIMLLKKQIEEMTEQRKVCDRIQGKMQEELNRHHVLCGRDKNQCKELKSEVEYYQRLVSDFRKKNCRLENLHERFERITKGSPNYDGLDQYFEKQEKKPTKKVSTKATKQEDIITIADGVILNKNTNEEYTTENIDEDINDFFN